MKRITITLPDDLARALEREARRRSTSASEIARRALARHLGLDPSEPRAVPFASVGRSGRGTIARDMEGLLEREWGEQSRDR